MTTIQNLPKYLIVQRGFCVFGFGNTLEQAIKSASAELRICPTEVRAQLDDTIRSGNGSRGRHPGADGYLVVVSERDEEYDDYLREIIPDKIFKNSWLEVKISARVYNEYLERVSKLGRSMSDILVRQDVLNAAARYYAFSVSDQCENWSVHTAPGIPDGWIIHLIGDAPDQVGSQSVDKELRHALYGDLPKEKAAHAY